jgi:hypothetical protein
MAEAYQKGAKMSDLKWYEFELFIHGRYIYIGKAHTTLEDWTVEARKIGNRRWRISGTLITIY